jgi:hypothetical protein
MGPTALLIVPGVGLWVLGEFDSRGRLQLFATPETIAMAFMSLLHVGWCVAVVHGVLRHPRGWPRPPESKYAFPTAASAGPCGIAGTQLMPPPPTSWFSPCLVWIFLSCVPRTSTALWQQSLSSDGVDLPIYSMLSNANKAPWDTLHTFSGTPCPTTAMAPW